MGLVVGLSVGCDDKKIDGSLLGLLDGVCEGAELNFNVGNVDGLFVGKLEG